MEPTIIIGDVHGCAGELRALLDKYAGGRAVVFVGDLVAKGPDSAAVVQLAIDFGARATRGNHEAHVLKWWRKTQAGDSPPRLRPAHARVCAQLGEEHWTYIDKMPLHLRLSADWIVVHAGLVPGVPLANQSDFDQMNMRSIRPDGTASKQMHDGAPWASRWTGPQHVVFGHDAVSGLQEYEFATGLDTGCVYGKELTALLLPERQLVSVPAERVWCDPMVDA